MLLRRRRDVVDDEDGVRDREVIVKHGPSLAKGPALIAGSILVAFGLAGLLKNNDFPSFSASFPDAEVQGTNFLGFEVNGWTDFFAITAGALLLFGAAQHHLAKLMSLIVGLALAACAVIAVIDGQDVLGLAAANFWTKIGFAVAGGVMLLNALMPRTTRRREVATGTPATAAPVGARRDDEVYDDGIRDDRVRDDDRDEVVEDDASDRRFGRPAPAATTDEQRTTVAEPRTEVTQREPVGAPATTATSTDEAPTTATRRKRRFF
jgi:hypothetical protein